MPVGKQQSGLRLPVENVIGEPEGRPPCAAAPECDIMQARYSLQSAVHSRSHDTIAEALREFYRESEWRQLNGDRIVAE